MASGLDLVGSAFPVSAAFFAGTVGSFVGSAAFLADPGVTGGEIGTRRAAHIATGGSGAVAVAATLASPPAAHGLGRCLGLRSGCCGCFWSAGAGRAGCAGLRGGSCRCAGRAGMHYHITGFRLAENQHIPLGSLGSRIKQSATGTFFGGCGFHAVKLPAIFGIFVDDILEIGCGVIACAGNYHSCGDNFINHIITLISALTHKYLSSVDIGIISQENGLSILVGLR